MLKSCITISLIFLIGISPITEGLAINAIYEVEIPVETKEESREALLEIGRKVTFKAEKRPAQASTNVPAVNFISLQSSIKRTDIRHGDQRYLWTMQLLL